MQCGCPRPTEWRRAGGQSAHIPDVSNLTPCSGCDTPVRRVPPMTDVDEAADAASSLALAQPEDQHSREEWEAATAAVLRKTRKLTDEDARRRGLGQAGPHHARRHRDHPARRRRRPAAGRAARPGRRLGHPLAHLAPRGQARQRGGAGRPRRRRDQPLGRRRRDDRPRRGADRRAPRPGAGRARRAHRADRGGPSAAGVRRRARTRPAP